MKFDWYQATIPEASDIVTDALRSGLPGCREIRTCDKGGNGYLSSVAFLDARGGELGRMMTGGNAHPNFRATSHRAPAAAAFIRETWPVHRVTRLDVALDYTGEGVFDHLHGIAHAVAERNRLKTGLMMQPDLLDRGRTYQIGSTSSPVLIRLYEKGLHEGQRRGHQEDPHWTRLELQVRPQKSAKSAFASVEPAAAWGATRWTSQLIEAVMGHEPDRIAVAPREDTEWERTQAALVQQYGRHAIAGGFRAAGGNESEVTTEAAIEAYLAILRQDLVDHMQAKDGVAFPTRHPKNPARAKARVTQSS